MPIKSVLSSALIGLLATAPLTSAHSWIEQLMVIAPNGTLVGQPGFARGNVLRGTPGFSDPTMVNLIPPDGRPINQIESSDLMCKSTQTSQTQTDGSPRLQAAAGAGVALRFQENGHVTLPDNQPGKPPNRGTVYVYGTTQPSPDDSFLAIHRVWTADGSGGDGRGRLLSTRNFDDGQCYQVNGGQISQQRQQQFSHPADTLMGSDLWCQQDIQIPDDAPSGQPYTLYWVWDWPTLPGTAGFPDGKQEIYTTCMDVDIVDNSGEDTVSEAQVDYAQGQPLDNAAVSAQMTDLANPTAVTGQTIPFTNSPTTFLTQTVSPTPTTPVLTSSYTGSTIAFSASATGPVSGGASEASVSAATASETGVPAFLSVHVGSTAGPGIETQTFTVSPIGVFTTTTSDGTQAQQTGGSGGGRGGDNINNQPQVTAAPNVAGNVVVATFTEYESVTETVFQTVYQTQYTKRNAGESFYPTGRGPVDDDYVSPSTSEFPPIRTPPYPSHCFWCPSGSAAPRFTDPSGPPPWLSGAWTSRTWRPYPRPTGWVGHRNSSTEHGGRHGSYDDGFSNSTTTTTAESTITVASTVTLTTYLPCASASASAAGVADGVVSSSTIPAAPMSSYSPQAFPPLPLSASTDTAGTSAVSAQPIAVIPISFSSTPTDTVTVTIFPSSPSSISASYPTSSLPSTNTQGDQSLTFTVSPIPDPAPTPTVSTEHSVFRLRARNPFVMLGWSSPQKAEVTQSPSSSSS
ncbi:uncharacterized protein Z520_02186 [Fonsecaea multimorphosa CBS 102226]|uniref:DUF7492 domain-containing protein n=1 Tax=Fonsecaea multimorphosa CBS 102226 TaxID=1442371 RepID=A0A0D2K7N5_9EURO|nr:uncharacterized protein Z520_02186 [Fonsecaea multimorphosa CBS 102226]KIY02048.1 hypothetical protein Z520_02186 [Fonsecaea multimorphosa CBS 102226]